MMSMGYVLFPNGSASELSNCNCH